jgi:phage terminase Nu1 subunit (DNA packaging protein)
MVQKRPTQAAIAAALGISTARISQLKARGMPVYSVDAAAAWKAQHVAPMPGGEAPAAPAARGAAGQLAGDDPPPGDGGYWESRARREKAEAAIAEFKQAELEAALIRVDVVRAAVAGKLSALRDALLQMPARLAPQLAAEADLVTVTQLLEGELHQVMRSYSDTPAV